MPRKSATAASKAAARAVPPAVNDAPQSAPEAPTPVEPPAPAINLTVTNCIKGTTLCLADGSSIQHGESAEVSAEEAEFLRGRGQVE